MIVTTPFSSARIDETRASLVETRLALHRVAFYVLSPAREAASGRIGLRSTPGGFSTPPFDAVDGSGERILSVDGTDLVVAENGVLHRSPLETLAAVAEAAGVELDGGRGADFDVPALGAADASLTIDPTSATLLADWWGFGTAVLDDLRPASGPGDDVTEVQLWPEHLDAAMEMGAADAGSRASYGASPGDEHHDEPYLYLAAWSEIDHSDPFWNDPHFPGASLGIRQLTGEPNPAERARSFLAEGFDRLTGT